MALTSPRFSGNVRLQNAANNRPAMNWGEVGEAVRLVQQALIDRGFRMPISMNKFGSPDGIFGDETKATVKTFQSLHGLDTDGIVGKNTLAELDRLLPTAGSPLPAIPPDSWITHRFKIVFRSTAMPVIPEFQALEDTRRVYGMYGFRVDESGGMSLAMTPDQQLTLSVIDTTCEWNKQSDEQNQLFALGGGRSGVAATDIMVYYVNGIKDTSNGQALAGCAGHKPGTPAVVVAATAAKYDMAHEVGHVLLTPSFTPVHHPSSVNLMFLNAVTADPPGLTEAQVRRIRASALVFHL
jgi:hypothetical protein